MRSCVRRNTFCHASLQHSAAIRQSVTLVQLRGFADLLNNNSDEAPESLIAFLDGRILSSSEPSEPEPERPEKRRKLTGPRTPKTPLESSDLYDVLTLARVDISIVR